MTAVSQSVATPVLVAETDAHEGPVYVRAENALYFTSVRRESVAIRRLGLADASVSTVLADANMANGMALDLDGRLLVCEQGTLVTDARITRLDPATGDREVVVGDADGLPLNSPNDVAVARDGAIWFTDPSYGRLQGFRPRPRTAEQVYRFDRRTGELASVAHSLDKPNGLAFSPDGSTLYVGDSGAIHGPGDYDPARPRRVVAFDVVGTRLGYGRVFADDIPGFPDGIKVDGSGRVYVSCEHGVLVFAPDGGLVGEIDLPGAVNFAFGGAAGETLFITADMAVWAAALPPKGARPWS